MSLSLESLTFDCDDTLAVATFWSAALDRPIDPDGSAEFASIGRAESAPQTPIWMFSKVPEGKTAKNRMHVDLTAADRRAEVDRLIGLGAKPLHDVGVGPHLDRPPRPRRQRVLRRATPRLRCRFSELFDKSDAFVVTFARTVRDFDRSGALLEVFHEVAVVAEAEDRGGQATALGHLGDQLEVLLAGSAGREERSIDDGSSESLRKACRPPTGTYRKSSRRAVIHCSPSNNWTSPDRTKNDSEIVLWKCVLGPPAFGAMSSLYSPNSPWVRALPATKWVRFPDGFCTSASASAGRNTALTSPRSPK